MTGLASRCVLVTGGTGALGRAVVKRFLQEGATVHVPWVSEPELRDVERHLGDTFRRTVMHRCDVTTDAEVGSLFRAIRDSGATVDVLANIVGGFVHGAVEETPPDAWERMLRVNATSAFLCSRAAIPDMKAKRWGRIITVSSAPAVNHGAANLSAYSAAKAAVLNLTESLAKELVGSSITVNSIVPTVIDTPANRSGSPGADTSTWLAPQDIAGVIAFLASDAAGIVTGTAVNLSRG